MKKEINHLDKKFYEEASGPLKEDSAKYLAQQCVKYADNYSKDSLAPVYLMKASRIFIDVRDFEKSLKYLNRIEAKYPEGKVVPDALMLKGFVYDDHLENYSKAAKIYTRLIEEYPEHHFAKDAKTLKKNLGKSAEEMIEEFEKKNKEKEDTTKMASSEQD